MADDDTLPSADELLGDTAEAAAPARPQLQVVSQFIRDMSCLLYTSDAADE